MTVIDDPVSGEWPREPIKFEIKNTKVVQGRQWRSMEVNAVATKEGENMFMAQVYNEDFEPLEGCVTQCKSEEEVELHVKQVAALWFEAQKGVDIAPENVHVKKLVWF